MNKIYIKSSNFRNLILFLICLNIYMFYNDETTLIINTFQKTLYSSIIFIILCVNTINIDKIFDLNKYYIIRFEDKKEYINNKIKLISFNNFILFILHQMCSLQYHIPVSVMIFTLCIQFLQLG